MFQILSGVHYKVVGAGNFFTTIIGYDDSGDDPSKNEILAPIQLIAKPGMTYKRYSKFMNEKASVKFESNALDEYFGLMSMIVYGRPIFQDRPQ
jgi:hypothetical protein